MAAAGADLEETVPTLPRTIPVEAVESTTKMCQCLQEFHHEDINMENPGRMIPQDCSANTRPCRPH